MTEAELVELMCALRAEVALAECRALSGDQRIYASETLDAACDAYLEMIPHAARDIERMRTAHRMVLYRLLSMRGEGRSGAFASTRALFDAQFVPLLRGLMQQRAGRQRAG